MPSSRAKAKIIGNVGVTYDFPLKHFNLSANVDVNAHPITTPSPANLVLDINGSTNKWYFKFGEPSHLNMVNVMSNIFNCFNRSGNTFALPCNRFNQRSIFIRKSNSAAINFGSNY